MNEAKFYKVPSFTDPSITYTIRHFPDGKWACECIHFTMRWRKIKICDHIRRLRRMRMKLHGRLVKSKSKNNKRSSRGGQNSSGRKHPEGDLRGLPAMEGANPRSHTEEESGGLTH